MLECKEGALVVSAVWEIVYLAIGVVFWWVIGGMMLIILRKELLHRDMSDNIIIGILSNIVGLFCGVFWPGVTVSVLMIVFAKISKQLDTTDLNACKPYSTFSINETRDKMNKNEVIELMKSSRTSQEWNENCDRVREMFGGYPPFWYKEIILGRLAHKTAHAQNWGGDAKIHTVTLR